MAMMGKGQMAAWMGRKPAPGGGGARPPMGGKGGPPPGAAKQALMAGRKKPLPPGAARGPGGQGAPPDPTEDQPDEMGSTGAQANEERYFPIMEWLEESGPVLEDAASAMDAAALMDDGAELDPNTADAIHALIPNLPPELTDGMTQLSEGATFDDCMALGAHMQREGWVVDGDVIGGLLFRIFTVLGAPPPNDDQKAAGAHNPAKPGGGAQGGARPMPGGGPGAGPAGPMGAPAAPGMPR